MSVTPNYVPREFKTINVFLFVKNAHEALKFYNSAFDAEIVNKFESSDGFIVHAQIKIDDTILFVAEATDKLAINPEANSGVVIQIYTGDAEGMFENAINAGAVEVRPIEKQFYGDRSGIVKDPFGHMWVISTHVEDVPPNELKRRFDQLYS